MGGATIRHEPTSTEAWEKILKAHQLFREAIWIEFFEQLSGSDENVSLELARNENRSQTKVKGLRLEVIEEVISRVTTLQTKRKRWFNQKFNDPAIKAEFLQGEEQLVKKGRRINHLSLPQPWHDVALFIIKYIT